MRKSHIVFLEEEDLNLARMLGLTNLSEYVRNCISYFISGCDRELAPSEIRELSKKIAIEKRAAAQKQQKITGHTEEEKQKVAELRQVRLDKIQISFKKELERIGMDRMKRYMQDVNGDYATVQDDILKAVSQDSGVAVELSDIMAVTGWRV